MSALVCGKRDLELITLLDDDNLFKQAAPTARRTIEQFPPLKQSRLTPLDDPGRKKLLLEKLYLELVKLGVPNPCAITTAMGALDNAILAKCFLADDETEAQIPRDELLRLADEAANIITNGHKYSGVEFQNWSYGPGDEA